LHDKDEALVLLVTYAVFLILEDLTKLVWGGISLYANQPRDALGQVAIGGLPFPVYDLALVGVALGLAVIVTITFSHTRVGHLVTAVTTDREMSAAMGINVRRVLTSTFVAGAALGAVAGALSAPKIAVSPGVGVEVIVLAFAVVVVGGLGSVVGAAVAALLI